MSFLSPDQLMVHFSLGIIRCSMSQVGSKRGKACGGQLQEAKKPQCSFHVALGALLLSLNRCVELCQLQLYSPQHSYNSLGACCISYENNKIMLSVVALQRMKVSPRESQRCQSRRENVYLAAIITPVPVIDILGVILSYCSFFNS